MIKGWELCDEESIHIDERAGTLVHTHAHTFLRTLKQEEE